MPQFRRGRQCGRPRQSRRTAAHSQGGRTMKKLFMIAMAAAFSMAMVAPGFAQTTTTTPPSTMEKSKEEKKAEKAEKKADKKAAKAEKKAAKEEAKMEKKAANPCAAKATEKK